MSNDDWAKTQERLLQDIEHFSRFGAPPATPGAIDETANDAAGSEPPPSAIPQTAVEQAPAASQPVAATEPPPSSAQSPQAPSAPPAAADSGLLARLRTEAQAKLAANNRQSTEQVAMQQQLSEALARIYTYLNDLCQHLNILKPPYQKVCSFYGIVDFDGLAWQEGRADFRLQAGDKEDKLYDQVTLRYRLSKPQQFRITRDNPAHEKLHKLLFDHGIAFSTDEERNDRGYLERATFTFPCEIKAGLQVTGNDTTGRLVLRTRNLDRFGVMEYQCAPTAITPEALDELAHLILGEPHRLNQFCQRTA